MGAKYTRLTAGTPRRERSDTPVLGDVVDLERGERESTLGALVAVPAVQPSSRIDARERVLQREAAAQLEHVGFRRLRKRRDDLQLVSQAPLHEFAECVEELSGAVRE